MKNDLVKIISRNALVAAIYFILTVAGTSFSFGAIQIRIAEAMVLMCFFRRDYIFGLTIGCLLSNLFSPILPWDLIFGTLATFASCLLVSFCKHLFLASLIPVVINGFVIGAELMVLTGVNFWITTCFVAIGEFIAVAVIGYLIFFLNRKNSIIINSIAANMNQDFKW